MADERTEALREMATHRGLKLKVSRRRKSRGDFGRMGLTEADGTPVMGVGPDGLTATPDEVEAHLRQALRADWTVSVGTAKRRKAPPEPVAPPPPPPKPRFKPVVGNLFAKLPAAKRDEVFTTLLERGGVRIERIVSNGQTTREDEPMIQDHEEWVVVLVGEAGVRIEDSDEVVLKAGDHLTIAAGQPHWVTRTGGEEPTVWLAVHLP